MYDLQGKPSAAAAIDRSPEEIQEVLARIDEENREFLKGLLRSV